MSEMVIVVDVETTGFLKDRKRENYIVEIGMVMVDLKKKEMYKLMDTLVKEDGINESYGDAWVFENSDITLEEVLKQGKPMSEIRQNIQEIFNAFPVTAYNKDFDLGFLKKSGIEAPLQYPCIMKTGTSLYQIKVPWGMKWASVEEAWFYLFEEPYIEKHRAYDDVIHEAEIMLQLHNLGIWRPVLEPAETH